MLKEDKEPTPTWLRKRTRKKKLSVDDIIDIVWQVYVSKEKHADVARQYRVLPCTISKHVTRFTRTPLYLQNLVQRREQRLALRAQIGEAIMQRVESKEVIDSVEQL